MKCKRHKYQTVVQSIRNGIVVGEIKKCEVCGHELRISDGASSAPVAAAEPLPPNVVRLPAPSITTTCGGTSSENTTGLRSNSSTFLGKTVELEDYGRGVIVDQTEHSVGIMLNGEGCRVVYVKQADLIPQNLVARARWWAAGWSRLTTARGENVTVPALIRDYRAYLRLERESQNGETVPPSGRDE